MIEVTISVKDTTSGKAKAFQLVAGKNTKAYHKYAVGDRGTPVIASAYVSKDVFAEPKKSKAKK